MSRVACLIPSGRFSGNEAPLNNSIYIAKPIFSLLGRRDSFHPAGDSPIIADDAVTQPLSQTADLPSQMISYDYRGLDADFQVPQRLSLKRVSALRFVHAHLESKPAPQHVLSLTLSNHVRSSPPQTRGAERQIEEKSDLAASNLLSKHRLMFVRTRFLEQRATGITLPSTTQPEVCRVYEFVPVILVLE